MRRTIRSCAVVCCVILLIAVIVYALLHKMYFNASSKRIHRSPRVFTVEPIALEAARASYEGWADSDSTLGPAFRRLFLEADAALAIKPPAVTDKKMKPPSGDPHDYLSPPSYCWPDPVTGFCVYRDGQYNYENEKDSDAKRLIIVRNSSLPLALAYYITGNETYGCKAANFLRTFFVNATTKMNPHLNYAHYDPAKKAGTHSGVIRARLFEDLVDVVGMLAESPCWSETDEKGMRDFMSLYLTWLLDSESGKSETMANNNHGTFHDAHLAAVALFVGQTDLAHRVLSDAATVRLARQISPDGRQQFELNRSVALHYSAFNLEALSNLAFLARNVGVDLWSYGPSGTSLIESALQLVARYVAPNSRWPLQQIIPFDRENLAAVLIRDALRYPANRCLTVALRKYDYPLLSAMRERLLYLTPPLPIGEVDLNEPDGCPNIAN